VCLSLSRSTQELLAEEVNALKQQISGVTKQQQEMQEKQQQEEEEEEEEEETSPRPKKKRRSLVSLTGSLVH
jgi:hypothetical protein